jgi:hypothetical protein
MSVLSRKVRIQNDDIEGVLIWLQEQNISCVLFSFDFAVGGRPGIVEITFEAAAEAMLFKLAWS